MQQKIRTLHFLPHAENAAKSKCLRRRDLYTNVCHSLAEPGFHILCCCHSFMLPLQLLTQCPQARCPMEFGHSSKDFLSTSFLERRLTVGAVAHAPRPFVAASFLRRRLRVGAVAHAPRPSLGAVLLPTFKQMFDGVWPFLKKNSFHESRLPLFRGADCIQSLIEQ